MHELRLLFVLLSGQVCQEKQLKTSEEGSQGWFSKEEGQEGREGWEDISKRSEKPLIF